MSVPRGMVNHFGVSLLIPLYRSSASCTCEGIRFVTIVIDTSPGSAGCSIDVLPLLFYTIFTIKGVGGSTVSVRRVGTRKRNPLWTLPSLRRWINLFLVSPTGLNGRSSTVRLPIGPHR